MDHGDASSTVARIARRHPPWRPVAGGPQPPAPPAAPDSRFPAGLPARGGRFSGDLAVRLVVG